MMLKTRTALLALMLTILTCTGLAQEKAADVSVAELAADINELSSDEYGGRALGTKGLAMAVDWHERTFKKLGLAPLFGGSYRQPFDLAAVTPDPQPTLQFSSRSAELDLERLEQFVAVSWNPGAAVVQGPVVYAGHLITAPARDWDDVKGASLRGKILLVEVNEPGNREGGVFDGPNMTWYGRWVYKYEHAARLGAAGILLLHNDKGAGYGWNVVRTGWSREDFHTSEAPETALGFMGWLSGPAAEDVLGLSGRKLVDLRAAAELPDFKPVDLGIQARVTQNPKFDKVSVENVAGILRSPNLSGRDRYVIVSAHFDHMGTDESLDGDRIFNGAVDNCSATAAMIGMARHFSRHPETLPFHLVFVGVTAEETGLLGSDWFAAHMPFPANQVWANINQEMTNVWGRTRDVFVYGAGFSELTEVAGEAAKALGWNFLGDHVDRRGLSFRSDQLSFARAGIPAVWLHEGLTGIDGMRDAGAKRDWYLANRYHQVSDEIEEDWDLEGTLQMVEWGVAIVHQLARRGRSPLMYPASGMPEAALRPDGIQPLTTVQASRLALLPFECATQEYPNKPGSVVDGDETVVPPRERTPVFFGCFDWHSAVHGHWTLVSMLKQFPDLPEATTIRKLLDKQLGADKLGAEAQYFGLERSKTFERPYGWAWLLRLAAELHTWEDADGRRWAGNLKPLAKLLAERTIDYLGRLSHPIRVGTHANTAFALCHMFDYAKAVGDGGLEAAIVEAGRRFYLADKDCPTAYEPSGEDFISPCLAEADLMRRTLGPDEFGIWLSGFLPDPDSAAFEPVRTPPEIRDLKDPRIGHLIGLDFHRAWTFSGIAAALPSGHTWKGLFRGYAAIHDRAGMAVMFDSGYGGAHWLATFATFAHLPVK